MILNKYGRRKHIKMKTRILVTLIFLCSAFTLNAQTNTPKPYSIGEIATIKSAILEKNKTLTIYLPDGYNKKEKYTVIYFIPEH